MSVRKKAAVIGLGHQALEDHVPGLADSQFGQLAAVCDTDPGNWLFSIRSCGRSDSNGVLDRVSWLVGWHEERASW
ncbi:hypothetical protein [Streptomyces sediminimaris]|uniref:hypothetical protein n=1 Tax=Streptomyces sediminimaris TaxID=3383721 RepID=UPI00399C2907